jgi:uncharacterized oxidoreductase
MKIKNNTILLTGGATGIGLALAKQLIAHENKVIVCGRRLDKLNDAKALLPTLVVMQCDISQIEERRKLYKNCLLAYPDLNMLINNAGIQREIDFRQGESDYLHGDSETEINLEAIFHLSSLFTPHLMTKTESAIVNISSGLGIVPLAIVPVYSATKAALHSFSISLRRQLAATTVKVFEILPPIVDTDLDRGARLRRGQNDLGISAEKVAKESLNAIAKDKLEIPIGIVKVLMLGSRINPKFFLKIINKKSPVKN